MTQDIYLTGITTTGTPHIGNYVGAIRPGIEASKDLATKHFYFLADYHSLAKNEDPDKISRSTLEIAAAWLALGLDTSHACFYRQSDIPEILELTWILHGMTAKGLMNRAHSYKAAVQANEEAGEDPDYGITMGLFSYPVLMAADILMFNAEKTFETIRAAMPAEEAARWYGKAPPDLSLMARAKGADYVYNFLKGFYVAPESPTGVDNLVLAGTSMPHVLWELQGYQSAHFDHHENADGSVTTTFAGFEQLAEGSMDAEQFDDFVRDTVNFLAYISEPIRSERRTIGVWVLMFLIFFLILVVQLKKQIWKDVS